MKQSPKATITLTLTVEQAEAVLHYAMDDAYYGHEQRMEGVGTDPDLKDDARAWRRSWKLCEQVERKLGTALKRAAKP
jgi:hypothetical protein